MYNTTLSVSISEAQTHCTYPIHIGLGVLSQLSEKIDLSHYSSLFVVTDAHVAPHWLEPLLSGLQRPAGHIILPPGERSKSIQTVELIWSALAQYGCDRRSLVLNLGGGVIGDMGGFAACTFMRGLDFVQVPTTLLSMVDASVGGKLGVNAEHTKNLIGVFAQPQAVCIDPQTLSTLPERELRSGFGEVIKHGLIRDVRYIEQLEQHTFEAIQEEAWVDWIQRSCAIKADVVEADVREGGIRKILNFGHTVGHAIESCLLDSEHALLHGEAVGLGMIVEAELSRMSGMLSLDDVQRIQTLIRAYGLPTRLPTSLHFESIHKGILGDKKNVSGTVLWTLLASIGNAVFDRELPLEWVRQSLDCIRPE